ncbi:hypothetical protein ABZO31_13460 [Streptomyces sp. HUAS MG47]|uniref:hypothetical protein n=1 Tax=Streptomyces solicamelliae TaxID=3231716 RepID=UPI003877F513
MVDFVVNGSWGKRPEGPRQVAAQWAETFAALESTGEGILGSWCHDAASHASSREFVPVSAPALTEYLERENRAHDAPYIGYSASLRTRQAGMPLVELSVRAGGQTQWVGSNVALSFSSRVVQDDAVPALRRAHEILRILADAWDIDHGKVYRRAEYRAVKEEFDLDNSAPRCGRAVYLSANRAALAPEGLPAEYSRTARGGLIVDLTYGGTREPSIDVILDVNRELRAAGALEALPKPYERDKW